MTLKRIKKYRRTVKDVTINRRNFRARKIYPRIFDPVPPETLKAWGVEMILFTQDIEDFKTLVQTYEPYAIAFFDTAYNRWRNGKAFLTDARYVRIVKHNYTVLQWVGTGVLRTSPNRVAA